MQAFQEAVRGLQAGVQVLEAGAAGPQVRSGLSRAFGGPQVAVPGERVGM